MVVCRLIESKSRNAVLIYMVLHRKMDRGIVFAVGVSCAVQTPG